MGRWDTVGVPLGAGVVVAGAGVLVAGPGDFAAPGWLAGVVPQAARVVRPARTAATAQRLKADMPFTSVPASWTEAGSGRHGAERPVLMGRWSRTAAATAAASRVISEVLMASACARRPVGFAIPSDTVTSIAGQLIATGKVSNSGRASLGISAQTVADASGQPAGVGIAGVSPGGAAAKAGIQPGDIITALAGQPVPSVAALQSVLAAHKPGDQVQARMSRDGAESTVRVTLGSLTS
jgi:hypothetical protein